MREMKITLALLLSMGLALAAAPLHAESDEKPKDNSTKQTGSENGGKSGKEKDSSGGGAEPECN